MKRFNENIAKQLFRYRGQLPLILVSLAIIVIYNYHSTSFIEGFLGKSIHIFLFSFLIFLGHLSRALVIGYRGVHTSGQNRHNQVAEELNTTGLYSIVRHPLYLGNFLIWNGILVLIGNLWFLFLGCCFFFILYIPIMKLENNFLKKKFGEEYIIWAKSTNMFVPALKMMRRPKVKFSFKIVWKNEYPGIISTLSSIWFIFFLQLIFSKGIIAISFPLIIFAIAIFVFGLTSRYLKYKTKFFPKIS